MYDTIIIGAGMSGLAAGIRLAHFERRVCILERHSMPGGLSSYYGCRGRTYDVGLHAVTNYAPKGARSGPLAKLLRQLRLAWDELGLWPQIGSAIKFPGVTLEFSNDFALLEAEVARNFPRQKDNFARLVATLGPYEHFDRPEMSRSAREIVSEIITDPLLLEMLFCPVLFYGGERKHDMDFGQFSILFRSIFLEGLARPLAGIRMILRRLLLKFRDLGGELRCVGGEPHRGERRPGATRRVGRRHRTGGRKYPLLGRLARDHAACARQRAGRRRKLRFLDHRVDLRAQAQPRTLGYDRTMVFYNDCEKFHYEKPAEPADLRSGIVCSPNNFAYGELLRGGGDADFGPGELRSLGGLNATDYAQQKRAWHERLVNSAIRFVPDFRAAVVDTDVFTPATIQRFTGHEKGAIYGAAEKRYDGTTHLENLFLCGNDQGLVGIIGTILSGISIANRYLLQV